MEKLKKYLENINDVEGWCVPELWNCIQPIHEFQEANNIDGPIAEIGVHHGKFFIGLALTKANFNDHCGIDLFDLQMFNSDSSGLGSLSKFKENLELSKVSSYEAISADSMCITDQFIDERKNKYSLFSVDAGHTVEHTINDFILAQKMVKKEGVIFIDDYGNANWPGVQEGIAKYYFFNSSNFVPLLYTCNKLFVCNISYHKLYLDYTHDFLLKNYPTSRVKEVIRYGHKSLTIRPNIKLKKFLI